MDKRVVFAVAGAGKTSTIINAIEEDSRALIVTYTDNNTAQIKKRILAKFGEIPKGVRIYSYFTFLYSFCFRPIYGFEIGVRGITFHEPDPKLRFIKKNSIRHYVDNSSRVYHHRLAKLLIEFQLIPDVIDRLEYFFDHVYIDEVQDFGSHDFNLLCSLVTANLNIKLVGDFFQHTFNTSNDGNTKQNLHDDFDKYCQNLVNAGYEIDVTSLSDSYRCPPVICEFVTQNIGIAIGSHNQKEAIVRLVECPDETEKMYNDPSIIKLFYRDSNKYAGFVDNWGNTKGLDDFGDVCVVLNKSSYRSFLAGKLSSMANLTRNKLYVACTRANRNLYFLDETKLAAFKR